MWSASSVSGGTLAESFEFERRRWCERPYLFAKTRDDFDVVLFVLTDPSLLSCVSFSLRDDDYGGAIPSSSAVPYSTAPDESGFRKLRSINGTTNVIRSVSTPLAITRGVVTERPGETHTEGRGRMRYELSVSRARTVSTGAGAVRRTRSVMLPSNSRSESLRPCVPMTKKNRYLRFPRRWRFQRRLFRR